MINTAFHNIDLENVKYHAAISFSNSQYSVVANFGKKNFKFGIEDMMSNRYKEIYDEISMEHIDSKDVFDLVHDYLIHSGFVGTLRAFEDESSFVSLKTKPIEKENIEFPMLKNKSQFAIPRKNTLGPDGIMPLSARGRATAEIGSEILEGSQTARNPKHEEIKEEQYEDKQKQSMSAPKDQHPEGELVINWGLSEHCTQTQISFNEHFIDFNHLVSKDQEMQDQESKDLTKQASNDKPVDPSQIKVDISKDTPTVDQKIDKGKVFSSLNLTLISQFLNYNEI